MPGDTVDQSLIIQFADMMHVRAQQNKARLRPTVEMKKMDGDVFAYDGIGIVDAREITGRFVPTVFDDIEHFRRKITRRRFVVTLPIDRMDVEGKLLDPQGAYATACVKAMERVFDRVVIEAMFADVKTGRDFETTVTYANDGGTTVTATSGLTYNQLLTIQQNFIDADVGTDAPIDLYMGITGREHSDLMAEIQLTSRDYTREAVVDNGQISSAAGFKLIKYAANANLPLLPVASSNRTCFAMAYGAMCVGLSRNWKITIDNRPDYVDTTQVQITGVLGAVRTEGKLIQKITTTA